MHERTTRILVAITLFCANSCAHESKDLSLIDERRVAGGVLRLHQLEDSVFQIARMLRVFVPDAVDLQQAEDLPVLYLNDGQFLFEADTSFYSGLEWRVDETVSVLIADGRLPPMIVVGIDNGGREGRANEYLPWPDIYLSPPLPDPDGERYPEFLTDEVMPFVEARYPVSRGPAGVAVGGSSYGALAALYAAIRRPGTFGALLLQSGSLYVHDGAIFDEAAAATSFPPRVDLGIGTHEGSSDCEGPGDPDAVADFERLTSLMRAAGSNVRLVVEQCGFHDENAYARRLPGALMHIFPTRSE